MVKCPYCDREFKTYNGLTKHMFKYNAHGDGITREKLLADVRYGGVRPTCKCGCGSYTDISYEGGAHFTDYIKGHQSRVHNNWGHNDEAIRKSSETRKRQYAIGSRIIWNKGVSWKDSYSNEKILELRKKIYTKDRNKKVSNALKVICSTDEHREMMHERMQGLMMNRKFSISSNMESTFIDEAIKPLGIEFERQHYINDIRQYCDIYIPSKKTIVEFNGDFWHANPLTYDRNSLRYKSQIVKVEKDEKKREYCEQNGISMIEIWERDYKEDKNKIINELREKIL